MAAEITWRHSATAKTVYATIRSAARLMWNTAGTPAFEALTVANWADYDIALTESPADSYFYVGTWPAGVSTDSWYWLDVYEQAGAGPAIADTLIGGIIGYWDGTVLSPWAADTVQVAGTAQTAGDLVGILGTPANIDSGGATIADNLKKIADDNGGASFDATVSSLNKLSTAVVTGVAATLQALANTETTGTLISGTFASTYLSNGTSWVLAPVTPAVVEAGSALSPFGLNTNLRYTAATGQTINSVSIRGNFAAGAGRYCNVYAYNYITSTWDMLSDVGTRMNNTNTLTSYTYVLLSSHQKTDAGGDGVGAIRIGFKSPSTNTNDRLNVDLALVNVATAGASAADIADAVYAKLATSIYGRQVWIDTVNGIDGYVIGVNGLDHTPVLTLACAYQLCDDLGLKTISFKSGSNTVAVTLTRSAAGWRFYGPGKIALNGQSIADAIFDECYSVYGTSTGDDASFYRCQIGSGGLTLDHSYVTACRIKGAITLIANSDPIIFHDCIDATGAGADFELIFVANATAVVRNFQGALTLKNVAATNSVVIDGAARVTIDASCTAGSITVRGFAPALTGAAAFVAAGGTITQDARYGVDAINAEVDAALADYDPPTNTEFEARTLPSADYTVVSDLPAAAPSAADIKTALEANGSKLDHLWEMTEDDGGVRRLTENALEEAPSGGSAPTVDAIADAVFDEVLGTHSGFLSTLALETTLTAIKGAGWSTETLKAIDALLDAIKIKTDLITTGTPALTTLQDGGHSTIIAGATFDPAALTGLTIPVLWETAYWTLKTDKKGYGGRLAEDATALAQVRVSNPAAVGDGLIYLNAAAATAAWGSLALDVGAGSATCVLADDATVLLAECTGLFWDIKTLNSDGSSDVVCSGTAEVALTPTKTTG